MDQPDPKEMVLGSASERYQRPARVLHSGEQENIIYKFSVEAARLCHGRHCEDILLFDLRGLSDLTDYILIASGTSQRQIKSVATELSKLAETRCGVERFGSEGNEAANWVVLDFIDVVVHIFEPDTRAHYDLEMMWDDAPKVSWQRGGEGSDQ